MRYVMETEISIRPSRDIRTNYAEISKLCRRHPVAVTVNGREDTILMSHEQFNRMQLELNDLKERLRMYSTLADAADDVKNGRTYPADEIFSEIISGLKK